MNAYSSQPIALCNTKLHTLQVLVGLLLLLILSTFSAWPHGFAGNRIFPTTFEVDDPFVMDEATFMGSYLREAGTADVPDLIGTGLAIDYTAALPGTLLGVVLGGEYRSVIPDGERTTHGFGNMVVGLKYQFFTSNRHELIGSVGLDAAIGNLGDPSVGADSYSVLLPYIAAGKGLGDLPKSLPWIRPFTLTGQFGGAVPTTSRLSRPQMALAGLTRPEDSVIPSKLPWGFTIQYNLNYLQYHVRDVGLDKPLSQLIPVVEFAMESCLDGPCQGQTNGTFNPGLIWFGDYFQLGAAAQIPINQRTGSDVGAFAMLHLFIDDLLEPEHDHNEHHDYEGGYVDEHHPDHDPLNLGALFGY
jgi:hypothetical protein